MKYPLVEIGTKIGDLTVQGYPGRDKWHHLLVSVQCAAGHTKDMLWDNLASGRNTQCRTCASTTHGLSRTPEYQSAYDAVSRCEDPNDRHYRIYGAIGRKVEFPGNTIAEKAVAMAEYLIEEVGRRPSRRHVLDRINNDGNYAIGNLRWVPIPTSLRNRSVNRKITLGEVDLCLCDWAARTGLPRVTIARRLDAGDPEWLALAPIAAYKRLKRLWVGLQNQAAA